MPLAHKKSSMVFIMPYHVEPLERIEKLLTRKQLDTWMGQMKETAVAVSLPKVNLDVSHNLQVSSRISLSFIWSCTTVREWELELGMNMSFILSILFK